MRKKVIVKGPALSASGYGEHARFVLRALRKREDIFDIYLHNINWGKVSWIFEDSEERKWIDSLIRKTMEYVQANKDQLGFDLSMQVTIPNEFEILALQNIGVTAGIEANKVAPQWLQKVNEMDKLVVVSNHAKYGFENTKYPLLNEQQQPVGELTCDIPVDVVGYPVRTFTPAKVDFEFESDFNFLAVALWSQRKNIEKTIVNFVEEFQFDEDIGLVVKTSLRGGSTYDKHLSEDALRSVLKKYPDRKCKIYLLHGRLTEEEMTTLYQHDKIKCLVALPHGEGFGLPIFEAAHNGLPIVATDWSGHLDFLYAPKKDKKGKEKLRGLFGKVTYDLQKVQKSSVWEGVITPDSMWAYPKDNSAKEKMREVYKDYSRALGKAKMLKKHVQTEFASDKMYEKMAKVLIDFSPNLEGLIEGKRKKIEKIKTEASTIRNPKKKLKFLTDKVREFKDQEDKIDLLKDCMKGEKCYIVSCGPSLLDNESAKLKSELKKHPCLAVKQAYMKFENEVDIHAYNCANFKKYDYAEGAKPLVVEASSVPYALGPCDLNFFIRERDFKASVSALGNFDDWTLDKQKHLRPYGPGIMTELVIYLLEHFGFSEVITVGWDNKLLDKSKFNQHFYSQEEGERDVSEFIDSNDTMSIVEFSRLKEEAALSTEAIGGYCKWLEEKGCKVKICSDINPAPKEVERVKI